MQKQLQINARFTRVIRDGKEISTMKINKQAALNSFQEYVSHYDIAMHMIRLKVEHTYRVAELCEQIAYSLGLHQEDVDLAWLIGLLHDIGRFEQQKNYGTFNDAISIDHARYGAEILFPDKKAQQNTIDTSASKMSGANIRNFIEDSAEDDIIYTAIYYHSAYRVPENLDDRTTMFCHILRDADKIDILKVNVEFPLEEIYNVSTEDLYKCEVTPEVLDSFDEEHAVLRALKKTPVDNVVGHISLVYELVYPISLKIMMEQGYLEKLMSFKSWNAKTEQQFVHIREKMQRYCNGVIS